MSAALPELDQAWQLLSQQRFGEAVRHAAAVLARFPDNVSALACHAMALWKADGDIAVSLAEIQRAATLAPAEASIRHNLATLYASAGNVEGAAQQFQAALAIKPDDTLAFYGLTQNRRFFAESDLVRAMVALDADAGLDRTRREFLNFALAKVYDDLGVPERAMGYALVANRLGARQFDLAGEDRALDELRELARLDAFRRARDSGHPATAPLLIVGMPRSGTTLVEAILARHPDVFALGESPLLRELEFVGYSRLAQAPHERGRHEMMLGLDRDWLRANAESWLSTVTARARRPFRVATDKLPENAVRLGFVQRLFPHARVVHVRRHPLDTGVSNFFQRFSSGQGFSTRLDWIGTRTRQIADSMALWKTALDLPILDVWYERLVTDPQAEARRLVAFAGLDWSDACLNPEQSDHSVRTASQWQVRQPINTQSLGRWRRYEPWLRPMVEAMGGQAWIGTQQAGG